MQARRSATRLLDLVGRENIDSTGWPSEPILAGGKHVVVQNTTRKELNGSIGIATSFQNDTGRYTVQVEGHQAKLLALKPENLEVRGIAVNLSFARKFLKSFVAI